MIFCITITLFHKYIQINYYHDKHHQKQVRVRSNLFVFRVFCNAANHSKQNTMRVWSGLYRVFLILFLELIVTEVLIYT